MKLDPKTAPIPDRMRHLRRDPRGYPIFFMSYVDADGRPHFTVNAEDKRQRCIRSDLCSICGKVLTRGRWFIGGPMSAFYTRGAYLDPPMHAECLHYALHVCPYLALPTWTSYIDSKTMKPDDPTPTVLDPAVIDERPDVFVAVMATGQRRIKGQIGQAGLMVEYVQYIKPAAPYSRVEFWRQGERIDYATAITMMTDDHLQALGEYIAQHGPLQRKVAYT